MKKSVLLVTTSMLLCGVAATAFVANASLKGFSKIAVADPTNYSLVINHSTQLTESNANKYVLTSSGNKFNYTFGNADYDSSEVDNVNAICMLRDNGSGIYFKTPIQKISSFSIKFDNPGTVHVYFSDSQGSFTGEDAYLSSEDVFSPATNTENVYITLWCNITTYVESVTINYVCE